MTLPTPPRPISSRHVTSNAPPPLTKQGSNFKSLQFGRPRLWGHTTLSQTRPYDVVVIATNKCVNQRRITQEEPCAHMLSTLKTRHITCKIPHVRTVPTNALTHPIGHHHTILFYSNSTLVHTPPISFWCSSINTTPSILFYQYSLYFDILCIYL